MLLASLSQPQKEAFFCLAHNVVVSDGDLTVDEEVMMEAMRREMDLGVNFKPHYVEIEGIELVFPSKRARIITMLSLIRLAYADGAFEIEERCFLRDLCAPFDINEKHFLLLDNWVRRLVSLEREANAFM